jgi:thiol:disulfide interchange protein DsbD
MPCVLPVLSLKAISFVEQAKESRAQGLRLAVAFSAGVLFSFWALAAVVVALKHGGQAVGWGFQFQEPAFVLFMAALVLAFALNLFGVFEIWLPGDAMQGLSQASNQQGMVGAFGHGLVMTLLATPCSAPFLGTALGFAFTASAVHLFIVFTAVGLGLALPYALLASVPAAHAWLPQPGPWMIHFKDVMGFLLMATLIWLLWLLGKQVGVDALAFGLIWLLILAFAAWAWGAWGGLQHHQAQRWRLGLALAALLSLSGAWALPKAVKPEAEAGHGVAADGWLAWDQAEVARLHKQGKPVFVDFSADWCWTCKVNEKAVLERQEVKDAFAKSAVVLMRADWTRHDSAITAALREQGRGGVPMYLYYPAHGPAHLFPELLTTKMVLREIQPEGRP